LTELEINVLRKVIESSIKDFESAGVIKLTDLFYMLGKLTAYEICHVITCDEQKSYENRLNELKMEKE
jgi:hypothetical protein